MKMDESSQSQYSNLFKYCFILLLGLIISLPKALLEAKIFLVVILISYNFLFLLQNDIQINRKYLFYHVAFILTSLFFALYGTFFGGANEAIFDFIRLFIVFTLIYFILFSVIDYFDYVEILLYVYCFSSILIMLILVLSYIEAVTGIGLIPSYFSDKLSLTIGVHTGYTDTSATVVTTLLYIAPTIFSLCLFRNDFYKKNNVLVFTALICVVISVFLSGRRVLQVVFLSLPIISLFYFRFMFGKKFKEYLLISRYLFIIFFVFLLGTIYFFYLDIDFTNLSERWSGLDSSNQTERIVQFNSLLLGWSENPMLGEGIGGVADYIRNKNRPWTYELTYMYLLFSTGMVGFFIYVGLTCKNLFNFFFLIPSLKSRNVELACILFGYIMFFIQAATNPYFSGFDTLYIFSLLAFMSLSKRYS